MLSYKTIHLQTLHSVHECFSNRKRNQQTMVMLIIQLVHASIQVYITPTVTNLCMEIAAWVRDCGFDNIPIVADYHDDVCR